MRKYYTLDTYDFYCQKEENEEEAAEKRKKYPWKVGVNSTAVKDWSLLTGNTLEQLRDKIRQNN